MTDMKWKSMEEWLTSGPDNGIDMLVLLSNGTRVVASYHGLSHTWTCNDKPVGWYPLPEIPAELVKRQEYIKSELDRLNELERSSL